MNRGVLGVYKLNEYGFDVIITEKEEFFCLEIAEVYISEYLLPVDKNNFITLDGSTELSFKEEAGKIVGIVVKREVFGIIAPGQKK